MRGANIQHTSYGQVWGDNVGRFYRMGTKLKYSTNRSQLSDLNFGTSQPFAGICRG